METEVSEMKMEATMPATEETMPIEPQQEIPMTEDSFSQRLDSSVVHFGGYLDRSDEL